MLKKYPLAILEVLVLQRFPYGKDSTFFYFAAGKNLKVQVGDLVRVPWRKAEKDGVVVKLKKVSVENEPGESWIFSANGIGNPQFFYAPLPRKPIGLKPIYAILERKYLSPGLLDKLKTAARKYFVSWNHFAKSVVDIPTARAKRGIKPTQFYLPLIKQFQEISKNNIEDENVVFDKVKSFIFVSYGQEGCLAAVLKKTLAEEKQVLVIVPEKTHLIPAGGKYAALTHSSSPATPVLLGKFLPRFFARDGWEIARQKGPNIFIGTRSAIFAPFVDLGLIIVEDGQDLSHKQWDLAPLYDIRKLLAFFYPQAHKIYLSDTTRWEDFYESPYYFVRQKNQTLIKKVSLTDFKKGDIGNNALSGEEKSPHLLIRTFKKEGIKKKVVLINTKIEKGLAHQEAVISEYLTKQLISVLNKQESALLVVNHSGIANLLVCEDCGYLFRCPQCGKALSQLTKSRLDCRFCGFKGLASSHCPRCSGTRITARRFGIEKIKETLSELKSKADFLLLETPPAQTGYTGIMNFAKKIVRSKKPLILLGYDGIIPVGRTLKERLGLAAILDFDEALFYPDFRSEERTASRFHNLLNIAPKVYIQTSDPNQPFLRKIINQPYSALFWEWHQERKAFLFPPAVNIMRIDVPKSDLVDKIINELRKNKTVIEAISVPVSGAARKNKYQAAIVLKYQRGVNIFPVIDGLFQCFGNLRIDPDPEEL